MARAHLCEWDAAAPLVQDICLPRTARALVRCRVSRKRVWRTVCSHIHWSDCKPVSAIHFRTESRATTPVYGSSPIPTSVLDLHSERDATLQRRRGSALPTNGRLSAPLLLRQFCERCITGNRGHFVRGSGLPLTTRGHMPDNTTKLCGYSNSQPRWERVRRSWLGAIHRRRRGICRETNRVFVGAWWPPAATRASGLRVRMTCCGAWSGPPRRRARTAPSGRPARQPEFVGGTDPPGPPDGGADDDGDGRRLISGFAGTAGPAGGGIVTQVPDAGDGQ